MSDFQSAVDALNSDTDGPVTFAATSNNDSATVSRHPVRRRKLLIFR